MQQDCVLLEISSITLAEKAKSTLKAHGISSSIHRSSNNIDGCGYHLKIYDDYEKSRALLDNAHIPIHGKLPCEPL